MSPTRDPESPSLPTPPALGQPVDLILHVGMGKTGTSTLQAFLGENRDRLAARGVLYPKSPGRVRHARVGLFTKSADEIQSAPEWARQKHTDPATFRRVFRRRLLREIRDAGLPRVLLSDEILFGSPAPALRRLHRFTSRFAGDLRLVAYLRRQDDHMVSRYQQGVKIGWVQRLREWAREDMSSLYDYHARLRLHERALGPSACVVRRFEPAGFVAGSLFQDFLDAAGVDVRAADLVPVSSRNLSLDAESVEFLRLLNLHRVEHEGAVPGLIDNRQLAARLTEAAAGPVLTLPEPVLDEFMAQWEQTNEQVARDFLGDGQPLFRLPRRTEGTTAEQRLDPARLDRFLELLQLPEQLHAPLRRLAEQEAASA
jgi:hypothetical protein